MTRWYYEKDELKSTPSIQDSITYDTECRYRREGARFIIDVGKEMNLGYNTVATGVVYFHRFYMFHSFKTFPRYVTACCCLFLAGKVEETPKKCKDIIRTAKTLLTEEKFKTFGEDPKEEVMTLERILLQTIKFNLQIEHPYSYLLKYAKCLKGDKNKLQKTVQTAWTLVNDSLCTTLSVQWEPEIIAVASLHLAGKFHKFEVIDWSERRPKHLRWWDMFVEDVTMDLLEDICHQILDLYSQTNAPKPEESPPTSPTNNSVVERSTVPSSIESPPNSSNGKGSITPPAKIAKVVQGLVNSDRPIADLLDRTKSQDTPGHMNYESQHIQHVHGGSSTIFPHGNMSVPPPTASFLNHAPPLHKNIPAPVRPSSAFNTPTQPSFSKQAYNSSTKFFPGSAAATSVNAQRQYYPPQT